MSFKSISSHVLFPSLKNIIQLAQSFVVSRMRLTALPVCPHLSESRISISPSHHVAALLGMLFLFLQLSVPMSIVSENYL